MFEITPKLINKEEVSNLSFPNSPVENVPETQNYINDMCSNAAEMSSEGGAEFKIIFCGLSELLEVHSKVYESSEEEIVLKDGNLIPKNRVVDIKFNRLL